MSAISNDFLKDNLCGGCDCSGFIPSVAWEKSGTDIIITDNTAFDDGDALAVVNIYVYDIHDDSVAGQITAGDVTIDASSLDLSEGFFIKVTVVSTSGCISDGHVKVLSPADATGDISWWDKEAKNVITIGSQDDES